MEYKDFIIPLAWPEAFVRTPGGPYDKLLSLFNIHRNGYYKFGHAAFLLINHKTGEVDFFDFGRYISPFKNGRARSKKTDPEINFKLKAKIKDGEIENLHGLLKAINSNHNSHGEGTLYAGIQKRISHQKAISFIENIQKKPYSPYGPFIYKGTNCSRFVAQTIAYSKRGMGLKFIYPWYLTPAPLGNIFFSNGKKLFKLEKDLSLSILLVRGPIKQFNFMKKIILFKKGETTPNPADAPVNKVNAPKTRINVGENAQWLGGIGAGAWYEIIRFEENTIKIQRTQGNGDVDYTLPFSTSEVGFNPKNPYKFKYGSHGSTALITQKDTTFKFTLSK